MFAGVDPAPAPNRPEGVLMLRNLDRRLERLEAKEQLALRKRIVWLQKGDPIPEAEPGEELILVKWIWDDDDETPADVQAAPQETSR